MERFNPLNLRDPVELWITLFKGLEFEIRSPDKHNSRFRVHQFCFALGNIMDRYYDPGYEIPIIWTGQDTLENLRESIQYLNLGFRNDINSWPIQERYFEYIALLARPINIKGKQIIGINFRFFAGPDDNYNNPIMLTRGNSLPFAPEFSQLTSAELEKLTNYYKFKDLEFRKASDILGPEL